MARQALCEVLIKEVAIAHSRPWLTQHDRKRTAFVQLRDLPPAAAWSARVAALTQLRWVSWWSGWLVS